ncbi:uncharacterized protein LOC115465749 isoform X2 [Microcaecilia unicolor]|uniref:Uncharacterized protein LOC115465749 isoform X2 n=1 Tax=Microcaecilia unicolor TaxID=1415580 RepID=A0A6P7X9Q8_9AMPH|nr:uncharacterized protein LOC115465749 isoform X2 [Microcaecilia unicolor]
MAAGKADQVPLTFDDVAVYFTLDEWRKLEDWQKELYKTTMQENYDSLESMVLAILERLEKRIARMEHHQIFFLTHLFKHLKPATLEKDKTSVPLVTNLDRRKRTIQEVRRVMWGRQKRAKLKKPSACIEPLKRVVMSNKEEEVNHDAMDKTCNDKIEHCIINYGSVDKDSVNHNSIDLNKMDFYNKLDHNSTELNIMGQSSLGHNTTNSVSIDHTTKSWSSKTHTAKGHSSTKYNSKNRGSIKYNTKVHSSIDNSFKGFISKAHYMKSHNSRSHNNTGLSSIENNGRYRSFMDGKILDYASVDHNAKRYSSIYSTTVAHSFANHNGKSLSPISHRIISHKSKNKNGMNSNDRNTLGGSFIEHNNLGLSSMDQSATDHNNVNQSSMSYYSADHRNTELNNMGQTFTNQKTVKKEQEEHPVYPLIVIDDCGVGTEASLMYRGRCTEKEIHQDNKTDINPLKEDTLVTTKTPHKTATPVVADIIWMPAKLRRPSQKKQSKLGMRASLAYKMNRICLPDIEMCNVSKERVRELYIGSQGSLLRFAGWIFRSLVPLQTYKQWCHVANFTGTNGKMAIPNNVKSKLLELVEENFGTTNMREKQQIRDGVNNQLRNPRKTDFHPGL